MRCPKCSYLSYDDVERCRNCGYDFALATGTREAETGAAMDPEPEDLRTWSPSARRRGAAIETTPPAEGAALDLPLFGEPARPEPPPVAIPPAGPPLSVRRKVEAPRPAPRGVPPPDLLGEPEPAGRGTGPGPGFDWLDDPPTEPEGRPIAAPDVAMRHDADGETETPGLGARLRAGVIDAALLIGIDLVVAWLTFRVAGLGLDEWRLLPLVPFLGFLFLLDTAYLVTFTAASGQTIGKMLSGVRVVYGEQGRVPFGHAVLRSVAVLVCVLPLGLGLLPMFMDASRRGAHDRLAGTRVVPVA